LARLLAASGARGHGVDSLLEIGAHSVTAILATWIGLVVTTRTRRARGAKVFGFVCLLLVIWSTAIIIQRLTGNPSAVRPPVNLWEDVAAWLLPGATVHITLAIAFEGPWSRRAVAVLATAYGLGLLGIVQAGIDPLHPIAFDEPNWEPLGVDGDRVAWAFSLARLGVWLAGITYLVLGLREAAGDRIRRRQLLAALATVILGVVGGMLRILPTEIGGPRWVGVSLVAGATALATYAVLAQHIFLAADVATRAMLRSLLAGFAVVGYLGVLAILDATASRALSVQIPLFTAFALVATVALFAPAASWVRARFVVDRVDRDGTTVIDPDGSTIAPSGILTGGASGLRLPVAAAGTTLAYVTFVPPADGRSFTPTEMRVLRLAASYLGSSLRLAELQETQATALAPLATEREPALRQGARLTDALSPACEPTDGQHVYALGPLRVERNGELIRRWGGQKAGSRQAEAIFAMLFDRGERGAAKDEIIEIVWPDVDLDRADVAFHRTMLGLRSTLGARRGGDEPISFFNDRYLLNPALIAWSDVRELDRLLNDARSASELDALRSLEQARALYRGDYMDDVPYFGDSAAVEERRDAYRRQMHAVVLELADRYDARGEALAASASRQAAAALAAGIRGLEPSAIPPAHASG
jgi:DNA-binding SARP family transcriptional activator